MCVQLTNQQVELVKAASTRGCADDPQECVYQLLLRWREGCTLDGQPARRQLFTELERVGLAKLARLVCCEPAAFPL